MTSSSAARLSSESVWRDRAFVLFWLAQTVSGTGTAVTSVVLPILIFRQTGSPLQTAILSGLRVVPYLLCGLVAGALADRTDRRRLMVGCNLLNTALLGSIPTAAWLGVLTLPQIYLVALLSATAFVLFDAANFGALPTLVGPTRIVAANPTVHAVEARDGRGPCAVFSVLVVPGGRDTRRGSRDAPPGLDRGAGRAPSDHPRGTHPPGTRRLSFGRDGRRGARGRW